RTSPQLEHAPLSPLNPPIRTGPSVFPLFPWPPPAASASYRIPEGILAGKQTFREVVSVLLTSLEAAGYVERSFFGAENGGIVLVTRLERINEDGTSTKGSRRWPSEQIHPRMTAGGVTEFLSGLFYAEPGYYRVIVFVIGGTPFTQSQRRVPEVE